MKSVVLCLCVALASADIPGEIRGSKSIDEIIDRAKQLRKRGGPAWDKFKSKIPESLRDVKFTKDNLKNYFSRRVDREDRPQKLPPLPPKSTSLNVSSSVNNTFPWGALATVAVGVIDGTVRLITDDKPDPNPGAYGVLATSNDPDWTAYEGWIPRHLDGSRTSWTSSIWGVGTVCEVEWDWTWDACGEYKGAHDPTRTWYLGQATGLVTTTYAKWGYDVTATVRSVGGPININTAESPTAAMDLEIIVDCIDSTYASEARTYKVRLGADGDSLTYGGEVVV